MSARNIHSLSLYLSSTETSYEERRVQQQYRQIFNTTAQQQTPPAIKECPGSVQHFYTALSTPEMIMDTSPEGRHLCHTSTIFQRGLITPTTPCYTPEATSSDPRSTKVACRFPSSISTNLQTPVSIMSPDTPESPDEDFGFSLEEFEKRYVPMSHLPTPPMSSCALGDFKIASDLAKAPEVAPEFLGSAQYLISMVPRNASRESPSVTTVAIILQRANLRMNVVSLACCILDCLSDQMLRQWRREVCTADSAPEQSELLAVAALTIAMKFLEDSHYCNKLWARNVCEDLFSSYALNATERLVLSDLNYSLLGISSPELLDANMAEIEQCIAAERGYFSARP